MNLITSSTAGVGTLAEPPVSPLPSGELADADPTRSMPALRTVTPPAEGSAEDTTPLQTPPPTPPVEAQLVKLGLLTVGQLAEAHRHRLETGRPVLDVAIEKGWVSAEKIVELGGELPKSVNQVAEALVEAEPVVEVEQTTETEPAADPEPTPPPAAVEPEAPTKPFYVLIHLQNGERILIGEAEGAQRAEALARDVVAEVTRSGADKWPFYASRFIRPETIVSVDVVEGDLTQT
ncbi:MAG: hypothetical protein M3R70_08550 [Actinomycetota bacterium]|nr:hypothetical protein [Actinomycetota bacterium]